MKSLLFFAVSFLASIIGTICGIGGGMAGRRLNKKLDNAAVDKLFMGLMAVIICICVYNLVRYSGL